MKKRLINGWLIALSVIIGVSLLSIFHHMHTDLQKIDAQTNATLTLFPAFGPADSMLFKECAMKDLTPTCMITSDTRYDLKEFRYGEDILLFYTAIALDKDMTLDEAIVFQVLKTPKAWNPNPAFDAFRLSVRETQPRCVDSIVCNYTGAVEFLQQTVYSDDFKSYYMPIKTFAIRYGMNEPVDMTLRSTTVDFPQCRIRLIPFTYAFLKKDRAVYFIALTVNNIVFSEDETTYRKKMHGLLGEIIQWEEAG